MISACLTPLLWNTFHALCFSDMQISKTGSKTRMQHKPRPGGEITQCILVVTPLAFWACDWSILPIETLLLRMGISEQFTIPELAELSPDCRILFCFFPTMHCTWKLLQKNKHLRITKKTSFTQKPRRPTHCTLLNLALEINNLSFYHTNKKFAQQWTTNFLILMQ